MSTRYSGADIEIHLSDLMQDWSPTDGLDVVGSNHKAGEVIEQAVAEAFPGQSVAVFTNQTQFGTMEVMALADHYGEYEDYDAFCDAIRAVAGEAIENQEAWVVESASAEA